MGTNYYTYNTEKVDLHIGKSSMGWYFALKIYPRISINSLEDWIRYIHVNNYLVMDEYGSKVELKKLINLIINRGIVKYNRKPDFNGINHCTTGINNLSKPNLDFGCVGYGPGPWSLHTGEFS